MDPPPGIWSGKKGGEEVGEEGAEEAGGDGHSMRRVGGEWWCALEKARALFSFSGPRRVRSVGSSSGRSTRWQKAL